MKRNSRQGSTYRDVQLCRSKNLLGIIEPPIGIDGVVGRGARRSTYRVGGLSSQRQRNKGHYGGDPRAQQASNLFHNQLLT